MTVFPTTFCGLLPHPPIVVPAVGKEHLDECRSTFDAARRFASRLVASSPHRLVLISPHAPRHRRAFGIATGPVLSGDLGRFGAADAAVALPDDPELRHHLAVRCDTADIALAPISPQPLDHGAVVPLWFLQHAGWRGPTTVLALPGSMPRGLVERFGEALGQALAELGEPAALVASGDMSHRVLPGAPAGYHPRALDFDRQLTERVRRGRLDSLPALDPELRELAAEDAADTSILVSAALDFEARGAEVLSYEHPFGVGYLVAVFYDAAADGSTSEEGDGPNVG